MKILILSGGTAGHIHPAISIVERLNKNNNLFFWIGNKNGIEKYISYKHNIKFFQIESFPLRKNRFINFFFSFFSIIKSFFYAVKIILYIKPDLVLGMGGYVSGPSGLATYLLQYSLIIHEQNSVFGYTNKILALFAKKILFSYPSIRKKKNFIFVGNPIRNNISKLYKNEKKILKINILILGGSLGSQVINRYIFNNIKITKKKILLNIWHQTGKNNKDNNFLLYSYKKYLKNNFRLVKFINNIGKAYQWADLLICRGGAITLSEISHINTPSIIIPAKNSVDNHQLKNAYFMKKVYNAILIEEKDLTNTVLDKHICYLYFYMFKIRKMFYLSKMFDINKKSTKKIEQICISIFNETINK